jgi:hypothetical protein
MPPLPISSNEGRQLRQVSPGRHRALARADRSRALDWIQIGSMAGPTIELPSVALRSANFRLQGNGQGAMPTRAYLAELPSLIDEIGNGGIAVTARPVPLADVETVWAAPEIPGVRIVLVP